MSKVKQECSFCGLGLAAVKKLVSNSDKNKYICDKCIMDCRDILANEKLCINKVIRFN